MMKNIYAETMEKVAQGAKFSVDFERRTLKVDNRWIIASGVNPVDRLGVEKELPEVALVMIENLYARYKHSIPSERSESKRKRYFYALPEHELDESDMMYGISRDRAQADLELHVLFFILNGSLVWDEALMGKWFWQSSADKDLIILKNWITK